MYKDINNRQTGISCNVHMLKCIWFMPKNINPTRRYAYALASLKMCDSQFYCRHI